MLTALPRRPSFLVIVPSSQVGVDITLFQSPMPIISSSLDVDPNADTGSIDWAAVDFDYSGEKPNPSRLAELSKPQLR